MKTIFVFIVSLLIIASCVGQKKIVCYFSSSAIYRPGNGEVSISHIDPTLCTHLIYAFAGITEVGDIKVLDPWADLPDGGGKDGYNKFNQLRKRNPNVKTLIAVGGWNEGSVKYSRLASDPQARKNFVNSAAVFVKKHGFDGMDFDWEYPNQNGGVEGDKINYVQLLREIRERFDREGLLLSAAVAGSVATASVAYIIPEVVKHLHFLNVMTYDYHGTWDKVTGINSPLYPSSLETSSDRFLNVNASINFWLSEGAPREKIIIGIPFYGRTFTLDNPQNTGIKAPAALPGIAGSYTRIPGTLGYNEICEKHQNEKWIIHYEDEQRVPYAANGNQWVGYDDPRSIREKAEFIKRLNLGGAMAWSIDTDDFRGICGPKFPLLAALSKALHGSKPCILKRKNKKTVK